MNATLQAGGTFGDYKVVRLLGKGGMGEVWLLEGQSGNLVAAKILEASADHEARKRFLREAQLAMGVKHPNLVETYDVGEDPESGLCYILMEYVPGGTLADYIKAHGALAIEDAIAVVDAMAGVLELARQKGIVHRDIKPANIMFTAEGVPKLADLGIARGGDAGTETTTVTQTGVMIGTPAYMSPEQMLDAHHVDTRADIYSLGVVFFEMLTGQRPNKDDTIVQLMAKAVKGEPLPDVRTLRPEVSASLAQLLSMMVVPDKDGRISTPGQITNALAIIERGGEFVVRGGEGALRPTTATGAGRAVAPRPPDSSPTGRGRSPSAPLPAGFPKWLIPVLVLATLAGAFFVLAPKKTVSSTSAVHAIVKEVVRTNVVERSVLKTNVVEKSMLTTNVVERTNRPAAVCQSPYRLKHLSELEPNAQKRLKDMGSRRRAGQRRGIMVFGALKVDGSYSGKDVASWAWLEQNGWFSADVWPSEYDENGGAYIKEGRRLLFLKHGYEPLEVDLSKEARRDWSDEEVLDLGALEMKRLSADRQCTLALTVDLPQGVSEANVELTLSNRKICGFDWGTYSNLQKPTVKVLSRRVRTGERLSIDGCTPTTYEIDVSAPGCVKFNRRIDLSDPTQRNAQTIVLQRARLARFALRPFVGGAWVKKDIVADNVQKLRFNDGKIRHSLSLDPYEADNGLAVSAFYGDSSYDDYGELTTEMFDRQSEKGTLAKPNPLRGKIVFYPGHIYRFRNSWHPIDTLIAFRAYGEGARADPAQTTSSSSWRDKVGAVKEKVMNEGRKTMVVVGQVVDGLARQLRNSSVKVTKKGHIANAAEVHDVSATVEVQKTLDRLFPGWNTSANIDRGGETHREGYVAQYLGRMDCVCTHPRSRAEPRVFLTKTEVLPLKDPVLRFSVAAYRDLTEIRVAALINGMQIFERDVAGGQWNDVCLDLSKWAGKKVTIKVVHRATGWNQEWAYWWRLETGVWDGVERRQSGIKRAETLLEYDRLCDRDPTRSAEKGFRALFPGWKVSRNGGDDEIGYWEEFRHRRNLVVTHMPNKAVPVVISRQLKLPKGNPHLHLEVASHDNGDFDLEIYVNGKIVICYSVTPKDAYKTVDVNLSAWAGKITRLEIRQRANGWEHENAFWSKIEIR